MRYKLTLADRFWNKVEKHDQNCACCKGCWHWTAAKTHGYGRIFSGERSEAGHARSLQAHRVAYEALVGPIPQGLELDHLCRNRCCVNPSHLEPVTYEENQRRGNSPMANQARQTHCKRGHPLDETNTYRWKRTRRCKRCNADQQAAIRARRRAQSG